MIEVAETRTERLCRLLSAELRRRAPQLDEDDLTSLTLVVKFNAKTREPHRVMVRPEAEVELGA